MLKLFILLWPLVHLASVNAEPTLWLGEGSHIFKGFEVGNVSVPDIMAAPAHSAFAIAIDICAWAYPRMTTNVTPRECWQETSHLINNLRASLRARLNEMDEMEAAEAAEAAASENKVPSLQNDVCDNQDSVAQTLSTLIEINKALSNHSLGGNLIESDEVLGCSLRHAHQHQELWAETATQLQGPSVFKGAIVILAQAGNHSSYETRGDSLRHLLKTLQLLYENYNNEFKDDVIIFHEGDFDLDLQNFVRAGRREIRFFHLQNENWSIEPEFVRKNTEDLKTGFSKYTSGFSIGYKKMIRWYAIRIWPVLNMLGYTWAMRLDDDSFLLSPIKFNLFSFMEHFGYQYAYRNIAIETPGNLFHDFVSSLVIEMGLENTTRQLLDTCKSRRGGIERVFTFSNCGHMPGYYNNFFLSNVTRWLERDVQTVLKKFDDSGLIFIDRWNDLSIQSVVVRLLFDEHLIHRLRDSPMHTILAIHMTLCMELHRPGSWIEIKLTQFGPFRLKHLTLHPRLRFRAPHVSCTAGQC